MLLLPFPFCTITDVSVISQLSLGTSHILTSSEDIKMWLALRPITVRTSDSDAQPLLLFCSCVHCSHAVPLQSCDTIVGNQSPECNGLPYSRKSSWGPNFVLCYLQLICVFNFRSVHFTQENTPIIMCILCVKFLF